MRIGSPTQSQGYFNGGAGSKPISANDAYSKNLEEQIRNAEKKLQDLSKDDRMPPDQKMKKQQEIRKEITELQAQLRQHEMELCQEERQQKTSGRSMEDMLGGETKVHGKGRKKGQGMSDASMKAMISADVSLKQADVQGAVRTSMDGKAGVLESEIKLDKDRGTDTAKKEAELADLQVGVSDLMSDQMKTLSAANEEMKKAQEEEESEVTQNVRGEKKEDGVKASAVESVEEDNNDRDTADSKENTEPGSNVDVKV